MYLILLMSTPMEYLYNVCAMSSGVGIFMTWYLETLKEIAKIY